MASYSIEELKGEQVYKDFYSPVCYIAVDGVNVMDQKLELGISDIEVDLSSGYEASLAIFWIYGCYDADKTCWKTAELKQFIVLGSSVCIAMGYASQVRIVFRGFVARMNFDMGVSGSMPGVQVTCMDAKGLMMATGYSHQIMKKIYYSEAVEEILSKLRERVDDEEIIQQIKVENTPDKQAKGGQSGDAGEKYKTIEMVNESDYEFVVKAAKKFNYEFFVHGGVIYFRPAKANTETLMEIGPELIQSISLEYDMTGLVENLEVRGMDVGKGKLLQSQWKCSEKISHGNRAKKLLSGSRRVYIDPTVFSKDDASCRLQYLAEDMSYRLETLTATMTGLPELMPGRFINLKDMGENIGGAFYLAEVRHVMGKDSYKTTIKGKGKEIL